MKKLLIWSVAAAFACAAAAQQTPPADSHSESPAVQPAETSADLTGEGMDATTDPAGDREVPASDSGHIDKYRRSSLYTVLMKHSAFKYGEAIDSAFMAMPTPDKFNCHDLTVRSFESSAVKQKKKGKYKQEVNLRDIEAFIREQDVARGMVAKWFNRCPETGTFDMRLIQERGNYDASQADISLAERSARGRAMLADAGEELIGKTFLLVNDITFVDKGEKSAKAGGWLRALGAIAGAVTGDSGLSSVGDSAAKLVNEIDGFTVNITSYLYRLDWNDEVQGTFYVLYWNDPSAPDPARRMAFDTTGLFRLTYVGQTSTSAANLSSKSLSAKSKESQMLKVCTRAIDKSIVQLQRDFDQFKVNVPLYRINDDGTVEVQIGLKEGINARSQFDVLMPVEGEDGRMTYEKVGRIQPIAGRIWDNRFGADEDAEALAADGEAAQGAQDEEQGDVTLTASTFKVLSGAHRIVPGCLVREVTIKRAK